MVKVSVVVPVYNVQNYIAQCLDSILNQTLEDIEILCIDDCGTDLSVSVVEQYTHQDNRIKLIRHSENQGLGGARNTGIEQACGKYIYFIDSDDYIAPETLEIAYQAAETQKAKIVSFDFFYAYETGQKILCDDVWCKRGRKPGLNKVHQDNFFDLYEVAWNKLYLRDIFKDKSLRYMSHIRHEDYEFYWKLLTTHDEVFVLKEPYYFYRQRQASIISSVKDKKIVDDYIKILVSVYSHLEERNLLTEYSDVFCLSVNNFYKSAEQIKDAADLFYCSFWQSFGNAENPLRAKLQKIVRKKSGGKWRSILKYLIRNPFSLFKSKGRKKIRSIWSQYS